MLRAHGCAGATAATTSPPTRSAILIKQGDSLTFVGEVDFVEEDSVVGDPVGAREESDMDVRA